MLPMSGFCHYDGLAHAESGTHEISVFSILQILTTLQYIWMGALNRLWKSLQFKSYQFLAIAQGA